MSDVSETNDPTASEQERPEAGSSYANENGDPSWDRLRWSGDESETTEESSESS